MEIGRDSELNRSSRELLKSIRGRICRIRFKEIYATHGDVALKNQIGHRHQRASAINAYLHGVTVGWYQCGVNVAIDLNIARAEPAVWENRHHLHRDGLIGQVHVSESAVDCENTTRNRQRTPRISSENVGAEVNQCATREYG